MKINNVGKNLQANVMDDVRYPPETDHKSKV